MRTMDASVALVEGMTFRATADSGHAILFDARADHGGADRGPSPMEALLMALGGCTGMDVLSMLRKMRQDVTAYTVRLHAERPDEHPRVFTRIVVEHVVTGRGLAMESVRRAVELSATRYCAASAMLGKTASLDERIRLVEAESGTETLETLHLHE